jgi:hypothetical protein
VLSLDAATRLRRRRRRDGSPDAAYAAEGTRPPFGAPTMETYGWLPIIMLIVVIKIKVRVK